MKHANCNVRPIAFVYPDSFTLRIIGIRSAVKRMTDLRIGTAQ